MKKKKGLFSRIVSLALSFVVGITTLAGVGADLKASASSLSLEKIYSYGGVEYFYFWGLGNNGSAFCVQNYASLNDSEAYYTSSSYYTQAVNYAIGLAQYYGYPNFSGTTRSTYTQNYFCATQAIIWEIVEGRRSTSTYKTTSSYRYTLNSTAQSYYDAISTKMINHKALLPSYNNTTVKLTYNSKTNKYEGTIKDTTGVATNMVNVINGTSGYTATKSGNNIKVTATSDASKTFTASKTFAAKGNYPNLTYYIMYSGHQTLAYGIPSIDPIPVKVTLYGEKKVGDATIKKVYYDTDGSKLNVSATLANSSKFVMGVLDDDEKITGYVVATGNKTSGYTFSKIVASIGDATRFEIPAAASKTVTSFTVKGVPVGTYEIKETSSPTDFRGGSAEITIKNGKVSTATVGNQKNRERYSVRLYKNFVPLNGKSFTWEEYAEYLYEDVGGFATLNDAYEYVDRLMNSVSFNAYFLKNGVKYYIQESSLISPDMTQSAVSGLFLMNTSNSDPKYKNLTTNKSNAYGFKLSSKKNSTFEGSFLLDYLRNSDDNGGYSETIYFEESYEQANASGKTTDIYKWSSRKNGVSTSTNARYVNYVNANDLNVYNYERYATASFIKKDKNSKEQLSGAEYTLYKMKGTSANPSTDEKLETKESDGTEAVTFDEKLDINDTYAGKYYIKETKAPKGYELDNNTYKVVLYINYNGSVMAVTNSELLKYAFSSVAIPVAMAAFDEMTVEDAPFKGQINVKKYDDIGNKDVSGISFDIIAAENIKENGNVKYTKGTTVKTITTDSKGEATTGATLLLGTYTVKEKTEKSPYIIRNDEQTVTLSLDNLEDGKTYVSSDVVFTNDTQHVELKVYKVDSKHNTVGLEGAVFTITAAEDYYIGNTKVHSKGATIGTLTTDKDGKATNIIRSDDTISSLTETVTLYVGAKYNITETKAPKNYVLNSTTDTFTATHDTTLNLEYKEIIKTYPNVHKTGTVTVYKVDNDKKTIYLEGAEFKLTAAEDITEADGTVIYAKGAVIEENVKSDKNGKAVFTTELPVGFKYTVTETKAPKGYNIADSASQTFTLEDNASVEHVEIEKTFYDTEIKGTLTIYKVDSDKKIGLSGAVFKITAAEDILYSDKSVRYAKGTVIVNNLITNNYGKVSYTLPFGKYEVTELNPPTLFNKATANGNVVELVYDDVETVEETTTFENDRQFGNIEVLKLEGTNSAAPEGYNANPIYVEGAVFGVYANNTVYDVDGSVYKLTVGDKVVELNKDTLIQTITTGADGKAMTIDLPVGNSYYLKELDVPAPYLPSKEKYTVTLSWNPSIAKVYALQQIKNDVQTGDITVYKRAQGKNVPLEGAEFELRATTDVYNTKGELIYEANKPIQTLTTGADGKVVFKSLPVNYTYIVKETKAPYGYVNKYEEKEFVLSYDKTVEFVALADDIYNTYQTGDITVFKYDAELGNVGLAGAEFKLVINETAYDADGSVYKVTVGEKEIELTEGTEIEYITTGTDGKATFTAKVPVGYNYSVTETKAPINYVNAHEKQTFDLLYDATVEFVAIKKEWFNDWQNGEIKITKKDGKYGDLLGNATFALVAAEDIKKADGSIRYAKGTTIETVTTIDSGDDLGTATFTKKVPVGFKYKLVEVKAPVGYANVNQEYEFDLDYDETINYVSLNPVINNKPLEVEISKRDAKSGDELKDAHMQLTDSEGNVIDEWVSDGTNHLVSKLASGTYTLKETAAPEGYTLSTDIVFTVADDNTVTVNDKKVTAVSDDDIPLIVMYDGATKVAISKQDAYGNEVKGATLQLINSEGVVVDEWQSNGTDRVITNLAVGTYTLKEKLAAKGYHLTTDIVFSIDAHNKVKIGDVEVTAKSTVDDEASLVVMVDEATKVTFKKVDDEGNNLAGATLRIVDSEGNIVKEWVSEEEPTVLTAVLEEGLEYTIEELEQPKGYCLAGKFSFRVQTLAELQGKTQEITVINKPTIVEVSKVSLTGEEELEGAVMQIIDEDGNVIDEWTSEKVAHVLRAKLEANKKYYVHEVTPPVGYTYTGDVEFTVSGDGSTDKVKMGDKETEVAISKRDADGNELEGATLQILDKDGNPVILKDKEGNVITEWISDGTNHVVRNLPVGDYILRETASPKGYYISTDIAFNIAVSADNPNKTIVTVGEAVVEATSDDDIPLIVMVDEATKVTFKKLDDKGNNLAGATLRIVDSEGNIVKEWVSEEEPIVLTGELIAGLEYTLEETNQPKGYFLHGAFAFRVSTYGEIEDVVELVNKPTIVKISKVTLTGEKELAGAHMQIIDEDGNVIDEWISTDEAHELVAQLEANKKYYVHELVPPTGYILNPEDIEFTITDENEPTIVVMNNNHQEGAIHIFKQDKDTKKGLEGAVFEIRAAEDIVINGEVVYKKGDVIATVTTDKDGKATVDKLYTGFAYDVVETKAPEGYIIENDTTTVKLDIDTEVEYVEVDVTIDNTNGEIKIRVPNKEVENPKTADSTTAYGGLAIILSLFGFVIFRKKRA